MSSTQKQVNCITVNTDASFDQVTGAGGYAFWIVCDHFVIKKAGFFKDVVRDSNEAEVKCIANALQTLYLEKELPKSKFLIINSDSKQGAAQIIGKKNEIAKQTHTIWRRVINKIGAKVWKIKHVKAHSGIQNARSIVNEWCDEEAKKHMKKKRQLILNERKNEEKART